MKTGTGQVYKAVKKTNKPVIGGLLASISGILDLSGAMNYSFGLIHVIGFGKGDMPLSCQV